MVRASSPPDATLASGRAGSPGLAPSSQVTSSPARSAPTLDLEAGPGHGQVAQPAASTAAASRGGRPAGPAERGLGLGQGGVGVGRGRSLELAQPAPRGTRARRAGPRPASRKAMTSASVVAVLAAQVAQQLAPGPDLGQPLWVVLERPRPVRGARWRRRPARRPAACSRSCMGGERAPAGRAAATAGPSPSAAPPVAGQGLAAPAAASRWAAASASRSSSSARAPRPRRGRRRRRRRARRPGSAAGRSPGPASGRRRRGRPRRSSAWPDRPAGGGDVVDDRWRRSVEGGALDGRAQQRLVGVLAVQVDEACAALGQAAERRHATVDVGPADRPRRGHGPGQDQLVAVRPRRRRSGPRRLASVGPGRTRTGSARPPSSSSMASTTSVLPAPVSPVRAVMPGPRTRVRSAITPRSRTRSSASISGRSARTSASGCGGSRARRR